MDYQSLLAAARQDPTTADFTALRMALAESPDFNPYLIADSEKIEALRAAVGREDHAEVIHLGEALLEEDYLRLQYHLVVGFAHHQVGNTEQADYHHTFLKGVLESILASGDGQSLATAIQVISVSEEYDVLTALLLKPEAQTLMHHEGHAYDQIRAVDSEGRPHVLYFNVDIPYSALRGMFRDRLGE